MHLHKSKTWKPFIEVVKSFLLCVAQFPILRNIANNSLQCFLKLYFKDALSQYFYKLFFKMLFRNISWTIILYHLLEIFHQRCLPTLFHETIFEKKKTNIFWNFSPPQGTSSAPLQTSHRRYYAKNHKELGRWKWFEMPEMARFAQNARNFPDLPRILVFSISWWSS